ncbi:MAG: hypothetical protein R3282_10080, partial [Rhodothermales bacterium]|nr:hypothetical protein [Rhodothermales bacterium]
MFDTTAVGLPMMLFSIIGLLASVPLIVYAVIERRPEMVRNVGMAAALWVGIYLVLLVVASVTSRDSTLPVGSRLSFCGFYLDCHIGGRVT